MNILQRKVREILFVSCVLMMTSLSIRGDTVDLSGTLVYGLSNFIYALDLSTFERRVIYEEKEGFSIFEHLTKVDETRLLLEDYTNHLIKELKLDTGVLKTVRSGYSPQYLPAHQKLFFYDGVPGKSQVGLFIADLSDPVGSALIVHEGPFVVPKQVIYASGDDVIFGQKNKVWRYNIATLELEVLPIEGCELPQFMRSVTNQLLCFDTTEQRYFLAGMKCDEKEHAPVSDLDGNAAALYILRYDTLIYSKARFQMFPPLGEVRDLWAYTFKGKNSVRLQKNVSVGNGSVIWFEK